MDEILRYTDTFLTYQTQPDTLYTLAQVVTKIHSAQQAVKREDKKKISKMSDAELKKLADKLE
jgi:hypothetical protein